MTAIITPTNYGPMLVPPYDAYLARALIVNGAYAPAEFETWRPYIPEGGVVADVGANVGAHTLPFSAAVGADGLVFAFEPQRSIFYMLCGSLALAGAMNVHAKQLALGDAQGVVFVPTVDLDRPGNFGGVAVDDAPEGAAGEMVPCVPLDSIGLKQLDFLKIDVEGMEPDVLAGAERTVAACRPVISAEADREENLPALLDWFQSHDYAVWRHEPPLGELWPNVVSKNLLGLPREKGLVGPSGRVLPVAP